jgi:ABC-type multidrug transport system fused ATPase/permease subunit
MMRKLWALFTPRERQQVVILLVAAIITAILDAVGVAAILPFMNLLTHPEIVQTNKWMQWAYQGLGFVSTQSFLTFLGIMVLALLVIDNSFAALTTWLMQRFVWKKHDDVSNLLVKKYLNQPYAWFLNHNSADLSKTVLIEVYNWTTGVMAPIGNLVSAGTSALFVLILLIAIDPALAFIVASILGGAYAVIYTTMRRRLMGLGTMRTEASKQRVKSFNEAIGGIKDLKVLGREKYFQGQFAIPSRQFASIMAKYQLYNVLPTYALETLAFGSILIVTLYLLQINGDLGAAIPIIGLYAFAGFRLLPGLRQLFSALTQLRFNQAANDLLIADLTLNDNLPEADTLVDTQPIERLKFQESIEISGVSFSYPFADRQAISEINLLIEHNALIGIVGQTGAGKTTLLDILLGLLSPEVGHISVDGVQINKKNLAKWRSLIGYVPQQIFLIDDTIAANIAFGIPQSKIDRVAIERAARTANLHEFVVTELPQGYQTLVGERGVRLSGGQRQRVGIARALYHNPDVLILDEATSSLDGITEDIVLDAISSIAQTKTLIIIAHRLSTIRNCDVVYLLDKGRIVAHGTYTELMRSNPAFQAMAHMSHDDSDKSDQVVEFIS